MRERFWKVGKYGSRWILRLEYNPFIIGISFKIYKLGSHYEWKNNEKIWFEEISYTLTIGLLFSQLQIVFIKGKIKNDL